MNLSINHIRPIDGLRVLIVEDEPLLAFDYQDELEAEGALPTIAHTLTEGLSALLSFPADFAILDVNLGRDLSWPIAEALTRRGTPYVIVSARCDQTVPGALTPARCIDKSIGARLVINEIAQLVKDRQP